MYIEGCSANHQDCQTIWNSDVPQLYSQLVSGTLDAGQLQSVCRCVLFNCSLFHRGQNWTDTIIAKVKATLFVEHVEEASEPLEHAIGSRALSFSDPYCCFTCLSVRHSVCSSATSELNISETRPDSGMVTMDGLYKLAYGLSIGHTPDDVT